MKITENYVSFEVAKLLKEKGFDEKCRSYYFGSSGRYSRCALEIKTNDFRDGEILRPTHQMACKWLREEKNLCIYVFPHKDGYEYGKWEAGICYCDDAIDATINACGHIFGETYEEAVEAAIKYTLENLI